MQNVVTGVRLSIVNSVFPRKREQLGGRGELRLKEAPPMCILNEEGALAS
jgi:hypothetical protein